MKSMIIGTIVKLFHYHITKVGNNIIDDIDSIA